MLNRRDINPGATEDAEESTAGAAASTVSAFIALVRFCSRQPDGDR